MSYRVRIDGQVAPQIYSYEQLIDEGIIEFDDIYVQQIGETDWHVAKYYDFPESLEEDEQTYEIDEYGQIKRKNVPAETSSSSSTPTTYNSSSDGWITFLKVLGTIVIIGITVAIIVATGGITAPIAYGAWKGIQAIWDN